ncbi:MAG: hypothetical protein Q8O67_09170 [Deltaproteobacteria bacterium]|nr:hypothetical protein [Deltaproteobacteria bacterium]
MEIKPKVLIGSGAVGAVGGAVDTSGIPDVSLSDVKSCLGRSGAARKVHETILENVANGTGRLHRSDIESMLSRAGVESTDVKTVLAYHAKHNHKAFDAGALKFLNTLDWSDVSAAHVDELKRQNKEQVASHQTFIKEDKKEFDSLKADDAKKMAKANDEKSKLQKKSAFELEGDFAEETTKSGLNGKEAFLLLAHRKKFKDS